MELVDNLNSRRGLVHCFELHCHTCSSVKKHFSSDTCQRLIIGTNIDPEVDDGLLNHSNCGRLPFEINIRAIIASREVGLGYDVSFLFLYEYVWYFNFSLLPTNTTIKVTVTELTTLRLKKAWKKTASFYQTPGNDIPFEHQVTIDGAWQTHGYSSLNGVVTALIDKKCIDTSGSRGYAKFPEESHLSSRWKICISERPFNYIFNLLLRCCTPSRFATDWLWSFVKVLP